MRGNVAFPRVRPLRTWVVDHRAILVSVLVVAVTGLALGLVFALRAGSSESSRAEVSVFFCVRSSPNPGCGHANATAMEKAAVLTAIHRLPEVERVSYESFAQALGNFRHRFADRHDLPKAVELGDIPDSYRLHLRATTDEAAVVQRLSGMPGVDQIIRKSDHPPLHL